MMNDIRNNTIFTFAETWLKNMITENYGSSMKNYSKVSGVIESLKQRGGGVLIIDPKHLNPKSRKDLIKLNPNHFESLWNECNLTKDNCNKNKHLVNASYNPHKSLHIDFL